MNDPRVKVGKAIENAREKTGKSAGQVGREAGVTGVTVRDVEKGIGGVKATTLEALALASGLDRTETDRLLALVGHVRPALHEALLKHPERWDDVLAMAERPVP